MNILINYATENFRRSQKKNTKTGMLKGKFDKVIEFSPKKIDKAFAKKNKKILKQKIGGGNWLWKPYIISKVLRYISKDDILFYCDSGSFFIRSIDDLMQSFRKSKQDVMVFELINCKEKRWTKRDAFVLMECEDKKYTDTNQIMATFFLCKKTPKAIKFVNEWLELAQDRHLITNTPNKFDFENCEEFSDHRHDQSILSLLSKKYGLIPFRDPSQYGNKADKKKYRNSKYKQIINLTRECKGK